MPEEMSPERQRMLHSEARAGGKAHRVGHMLLRKGTISHPASLETEQRAATQYRKDQQERDRNNG